MIPFLKRSNEASASTPIESIKRKPDEGSESEYDVLESAAEDLISAIHSKDVKAVAEALRAAFELCDDKPREESFHTNDKEQ